MTRLTLTGVHPLLDGEYDFDESYFSNWELHAIKNLTGLTAGKLEQAFAEVDNDIVVAIAMVALMRSGKITSRTPWASEQIDALWKAPTGQISMDFGAEDDVDPPELPVSGDAASGSNGSSGSSSMDASESPDDIPALTGSQPSDTGAA